MEHFKTTDTSVHIVPKLSVEDGIEATRQTLPQCHFNKTKCWAGVEALRVYRKKWDENNQVFMNKPLHDFASDDADAFRYLSIVAHKGKKPAPAPHSSLLSGQNGLTNYNLDRLYAEKARKQGRSLQKLRI